MDKQPTEGPELEASFDSAGPLAQDALLERLLPRIMSRINGAPAASVPAPKGKA